MDQAKKSGHFEGSSQFQCYYDTDLHLSNKYSSFLGVKNIRSVSKIMEMKVAEINASLN